MSVGFREVIAFCLNILLSCVSFGVFTKGFNYAKPTDQSILTNGHNLDKSLCSGFDSQGFERLSKSLEVTSNIMSNAVSRIIAQKIIVVSIDRCCDTLFFTQAPISLQFKPELIAPFYLKPQVSGAFAS